MLDAEVKNLKEVNQMQSEKIEFLTSRMEMLVPDRPHCTCFEAIETMKPSPLLQTSVIEDSINKIWTAVEDVVHIGMMYASLHYYNRYRYQIHCIEMLTMVIAVRA